MLNFRLARPDHLIDLRRVHELGYVRRHDGALRLGATTTQATVQQSAITMTSWPLLTDALALVAHPQIRNRGTIGGSVAHADPAAELPAALSALEAKFHVRSVRGSRCIGCDEFFVTHLTTALEPDELLVEVEVPPLRAETGWAFAEFARRHGDFALAGAAVLLRVENDQCHDVRISLLAAADTPVRAHSAEQFLDGEQPMESALAAAAEHAVRDVVPTGDVHGGTSYRRRLLQTMVRRALRRAVNRVNAGGGDV
jgi:CO/xanthine dehydrogenase FAD-binding subunit